MAKVNNLLLEGMSGSIGKTLVLRKSKNGTFSGKHPDMSAVIPSKNQTKGREHFARAVKFAKSVMKDPEKGSEFRNNNGGAVYHAAMKEYLNRFNPDKSIRFLLPEAVKASLEALSLTEPHLRASIWIREYKKLSNSDYRNINNVSKATATRHLRELADLNIIQFNGGRGAGAGYLIGSWWEQNGLIGSKQENK